VLFTLLVVHEDALLQGFGGDFAGDGMACCVGCEFRGDFEGVERVARVARGIGGKQFEGTFACSEMLRAQAAVRVGDGTLEEGEDLRVGELLECVDAAAREEDGFSVVAPMRRMEPRSTQGRKASCCARLKR
jgi:hypothetical protein